MSSETGLGASADHLTSLLLQHTKNVFMATLSSSDYEEYEQVCDPLLVYLYAPRDCLLFST